MTSLKHAVLVVVGAAMALGQRPSFAGFRPIGYPEMAPADELGNRFGENNLTTTTNIPTTTQRLPVEANGDRELVNRLSKLPIDKQPFWLINWQALEANRNNPQTYPQKPNQFAQPVQPVPINTNLNETDIRAGDNVKENPNSNTNSDPVLNKPTKSPNRDVDISAFLNNNNGGLNKPIGNTNFNFSDVTRPVVDTARPDNTLGNRNGNNSPNVNIPSSGFTNPTTTPRPNPQTSRPMSSSIGDSNSRPVLSPNIGQVVNSFEEVPYKPYIPNSQINPNWDPNSFESPYPILDPKTRNPESWPLVNLNAKPSNNEQIIGNARPLGNRFGDYDYKEQQVPLIARVPLGLRRIQPDFFY